MSETIKDKALAQLVELNVLFETKNGGSHVVLEGNTGYIDYWPGTGKWKDRTAGVGGFGFHNLKTHLGL